MWAFGADCVMIVNGHQYVYAGVKNPIDVSGISPVYGNINPRRCALRTIGSVVA